MAKKNDDMRLNADEMRELLRYFIGNPVPYTQDARFRALADAFVATDDRPYSEDPRVPQAQFVENSRQDSDEK